MNKGIKLRTFQFVNDGAIISPILTTIREYGRWMLLNFDNYTCQQELEIHSNKDKLVDKGGMEWHPGTRIGDYFKKNNGNFCDPVYFSWYIGKDCGVFSKLQKMGLCEKVDAIPFSVKDIEKRQMIRCYSLQQLEVYIRTNLQSDFVISDKYLVPRNIVLRNSDLLQMVIPKKKKKRRSLLDRK